MTQHEWFQYWNLRLWQAVAREDLPAEYEAIAMLYCNPVRLLQQIINENQ